MRIVVVGAGGIGSNLVKMLVKGKHEVVAIDIDGERCSRLSAEVDALIIKGDATKLETLKDAEVSRADVFVAVTGRDEVNMLSCLIARRLGCTRTIARIGEPKLAELVEELGVDKAVSPEIVTAKIINSIIAGGYSFMEVLTSEEGLKLVEVPVAPSSQVVGKTIKDVSMPPSLIILAVSEGGPFFRPDENFEFKEGQRLIILVKDREYKEALSLFLG